MLSSAFARDDAEGIVLVVLVLVRVSLSESDEEEDVDGALLRSRREGAVVAIIRENWSFRESWEGGMKGKVFCI